MEFLIIDPNLAYCVLVLAVFMTVVAILVPGTSIPEICAAILILAAILYGMQFPVRPWSLVILAIGLAMVLGSLFTSRHKTRLLSIGVLILLIASIFVYAYAGEIVSVNLWFVLFMSTVCYGLIWVISRKSIESFSIIPYDSERNIIGQQLILPYDIDKHGSLTIDSEDWSVESDHLIPANSLVEVDARNGLTLHISPVDVD